MRTITLTASENEQDVASALQAGARGYILKGSSGLEVVETVRAIYRGDTYVALHLAARLLIKKSKQIEIVVNDNLHHLTSREEEIFALVSGGMPNKEVATRRKTATRRNLRLEAPPVGDADFGGREGCTENRPQSRDLRSLKTLRFCTSFGYAPEQILAVERRIKPALGCKRGIPCAEAPYTFASAR
jgi:hypothetical protein